MVEDAPVRFEVEGRVARLTLDRPDQLNALDDEARVAIRDALLALEDRPDVSVVVLAGEGRAFSAGANLRRTAYAPIADDADWATRRHRTGSWQRLIDQLGAIPQATVAVLHGHVIGGAALLAAAFDLRIAADDTLLRIPELALGMPLTWAGLPLVAREVGLPVARDWVMTGRVVEADELLRTGFATRVVPRAELDGAVQACLDELLAAPPAALAMTRALSAAMGRTAPGMVAAWGDADHQQWAFSEPEQHDAARRYLDARRR